MAILRAQVIWHHRNGLARDNVVNTFHFSGPTDTATLDDIYAAMNHLYSQPNTGGSTAALDEYFSSTLNTYDVKIYDVTTEPAGSPIFSHLGLSRGTAINAANLPSEVSACVSFEATPVGGTVQKRRRGRTFLPPLNHAALAYDATTNVPRPSTGLRTTASLAFQRMAAELDDHCEWVVYSRPFPGRFGAVKDNGDPKPDIPARPGLAVGIDSVWVDDAFDIQRRRGERPTGRGTVLATA